MTDFIGLGGLALMLAGLPVRLVQCFGVSRKWLLAVLLVSLVAFLFPWKGHSLVFYVRGIVGDISVSSLVLLCVLHARALIRPACKHQPIHGQVGLVLLAILLPLYFSTLGYLTFDLYRWGYQPQWMLVAAGLLLFWAWQTQPALAIAWLIGIVSFALGFTRSRNLWDAMFDPFMAFAAVGLVVHGLVQMIFKRNVKKPEELAATLRQAA